jgi:hypothetical protein
MKEIIEMDAELAVNFFWFLSILTAALYIAKKKYKEKKEYELFNKAFKFCFGISMLMILISLYLLII